MVKLNSRGANPKATHIKCTLLRPRTIFQPQFIGRKKKSIRRKLLPETFVKSSFRPGSFNCPESMDETVAIDDEENVGKKHE